MTQRRKDIAMLLAARCVAARQVTDLISLRMRPDVLESNESLPACTYEALQMDEWSDLSGSSGESSSRVEFNCYADSREGANKVALAIRDVLYGLTGEVEYDDDNSTFISDCIVDNRYTRREPESPGSNRWRFRTVLDFVVTHTEPEPSLVLE